MIIAQLSLWSQQADRTAHERRVYSYWNIGGQHGYLLIYSFKLLSAFEYLLSTQDFRLQKQTYFETVNK